MKKLTTLTGWMVVAAAFIAGITACRKGESGNDEPPVTTATPKTYTMTVSVSKGEYPLTRSLSLGDETIDDSWATGDTVSVYAVTGGVSLSDPSVYTKVGKLTASTGGATATLTGEVTFSGKPRLELYCGSPSWTFDGQKGTLEDIAANYDYAMVALAPSGYDLADGILTPKKNSLSFTKQQAIVKFTLEDANGTPVSADSLTLRKAGSKYFNLNYNASTAATSNDEYFTVTRDDASSEFFVAIRPIYDFDLSLKTTVADRDFSYELTNVAFERGKYYEIAVKMNQLVDLGRLEHDMTAINGDVITGSRTDRVELFIADSATVTLRNVTISLTATYDFHKLAGITCLGDATVNLEGANTVKSFCDGYPGIFVPADKTLTIQGNGSLDVRAVRNSPGIGSSAKEAGGNIIIKGGTIKASGEYGAGIGGAYGQNCGNITISGGDITATGDGGPGIGSCGDITISGGIITAIGNASAGIGGGCTGGCGNITISDGTIRAYGITGIGSGSGGENTCGNISISGGTILAQGRLEGAAIGSGYHGYVGDIIISGGNVETDFDYSNGRAFGAGIGSGLCGQFKSITVTDGITRVKAVAGNHQANIWPIGKGEEDNGSGSVTIGAMPVYGKDWSGSGILTNLRFDNSVDRTWLLWNVHRWTPE